MVYIYIYIYNLAWCRYIMMFSLFGHMVKKNIKFTHEFNNENITFPDLKMSLSGGQLSTDLHIRSKDKPQYLHYISAHPDYTKHSIVFRPALSVSRICSNKTDLKTHLEDVISWFQARGYPKHSTQKEMSKVWFNKENSNNKQIKSKRVTFVVTCHPLLKSFQSLINKHLNIFILMKILKKFLCLGPW